MAELPPSAHPQMDSQTLLSLAAFLSLIIEDQLMAATRPSQETLPWSSQRHCTLALIVSTGHIQNEGHYNVVVIIPISYTVLVMSRAQSTL